MGSKSEYDRGVNTFSPEGRIFQIEYAMNAAQLGSTSVGIQTADGVLIAAEKKVPSKLVDNHQFTYGEPMRIEACTLAVSDSCLRFGERKGATISRPFGVSLLIAGVDDLGPQLWLTDPSGTYVRYEAKAIGRGMEAQATLQEKYHKSLTLAEAEVLAVSILKQVMEEEVRNDNVEVACIRTSTRKLEIYGPARLDEIIKNVE